MTKIEKEAYDKIQKTCKMCGKTYYKSWNKCGRSDFCSNSCAAKYSTYLNRKEISEKVSNTIRTKALEKYYANPKLCKICGKILSFEKRKCKTCSTDCLNKLKTISLRGNPNGKKGGYREGGGRSKSGYYNNIFMGSTYELVYYIYQTEHGKIVKRNFDSFPYKYKGKNHLYFPDFIVDEKYIEIKGYYKPIVDVKLDAVKKAGKEIEIFYKKDLEHMMKYVDETYHTNSTNRFTLYQNYKPQYRYICDNCGKEYFTNYKKKESKTKKYYCCRLCCFTRKREK